VKDDMLTRGSGSIVCLSSIGALRPRARQIDYCAAKAGVLAMVRCFAEALAPAVRVNGVAPGLVDTDMIADLDQSALPGRIETTPLKRLGSAHEIAETVAFLHSERASFTTGQTLVVSGGSVMEP
jgi:3-oxoacyl-[acyl-carrier protein] reductase